jgi:AAHS family 4-hydroxybenzoate transporter-like MFS transporter
MATPATIDVPDLLDRQAISGYQVRVMALCAAVVFLDGFDTQVIGNLVPAIIGEWKVSRPAMAPAGVAGLVGLMIGALALGPLADMIGRRAVIIGSTLAFGAMTVLTGLMADSVTSLVVLRFLTGLGLGGAMPNAIAMTAEYAPKRRQATMVMVMFCGFPLGASFAGFISAYLIPAFGWRSVLYLGGVLPIALVPLLLAQLPESIRHLVLRGDQAARIGTILARINPALAFAAGTRFTIGEQHGGGVPVGHLFREGRAAPTVLLWIVFFMSLLNIFLINFWLPTLTHDAGIALALANMATGLFQAGGVVSTLLGGRAVDAYGAYRVLSPAYVLAGLSIGALGFVVASPVLLVIAATLAGFCLIGGQTGVNALASTFYPTFIRSTGVGWALGIGRIGSIAGPAVGGILIALKWPTTAIFLIGGTAALCAAIALFAMGRTPAARAQLAGARAAVAAE